MFSLDEGDSCDDEFLCKISLYCINGICTKKKNFNITNFTISCEINDKCLDHFIDKKEKNSFVCKQEYISLLEENEKELEELVYQYIQCGIQHKCYTKKILDWNGCMFFHCLEQQKNIECFQHKIYGIPLRIQTKCN